MQRHLSRREFDELLSVIDRMTVEQVDVFVERVRQRFSLEDNPPEPPEAAAAVPAYVPRKPFGGSPGAAAMPEPDPLLEEMIGIGPV